MEQFVILQKPKFGDTCNRCGLCCKEEACRVSLDILGSKETPCIALEIEPDGRFSCGMIKRPFHYLHPNLGFEADPIHSGMVSNLIKELLYVGEGCGMPDYLVKKD